MPGILRKGEFARVSRLNVANRTLAITDNLPFLRSLNNECIDLIAIDPPFAANETFTGRPRPPISPAEYGEEAALAARHGAAHNEGIGETRVRDVWSWDADIHPSWKAGIEDDYPKVFSVVQAVEACATENEAAYIAYMAVRLIECYRVLKPTGSIYVHCDNHANSYLRMLLDGVFGAGNYRNEITWRRHTSVHGSFQHRPRQWGRITETILFYAKSRNTPILPYGKMTETERDAKFSLVDEDGRRYYDDSAHIWNSPNMGARPNQCYEWRGYRNPHPSGWRLIKERLEEEYQKGNIVILPNGRLQRRMYESDFRGTPLGNLWVDINPASGHERTGYATQKPLALYERIVQASSNPGDVVLDIFAGCATTAVAAERLGRQWIACDMAYRSWTMLKRRFYLNNMPLTGTTQATVDALKTLVRGDGPALQGRSALYESHIIGPQELPAREDTDPEPYHPLQQSRPRGRLAGVQTASWSGRISKEAARALLIEKFGPRCWGCGYEPRRPNGGLDLDLLEVDHIRARRAAAGTPGSDELYNLAMLHRTCNRIKGNRLTLEELRQHNALHGLLYVDSLNDLVDLYEATRFAAEQIAAYDVRHRRPETTAF